MIIAGKWVLTALIWFNVNNVHDKPAMIAHGNFQTKTMCITKQHEAIAVVKKEAPAAFVATSCRYGKDVYYFAQ